MEKEMIDILKSEPAYFGRQGENIAREVIFDITSLKREFPDAVYSLVLQRPGEEETYTASATTVNGNEFRYQPDFWSTEVPGTGNWEIHAIDAETNLVAKSITGTYIVDEALGEAANASPEVADNWISQVTTARDEAVAAAHLATETVSIDVNEIKTSIAGKVDKPDLEGTLGQLLTSDGVGGQVWADPPETYHLPAATTRRMGGVIVGDGLEIDGDGKLTAPSAAPATEENDGLFRAVDQKKLNGIEEGANKYTLPKATRDTLGGVKIGANLTVDENGTVSAEAERLRTATVERLGGVKVGDHLQSDPATGKLDVVIPKASMNALGGIKVGRNLEIEEDGTLNSQDSYILPTATPTRLGGIKVGENLTVNENGVLSADAQPIQPATDQELGGIKIGDGLSIDETGVASAYTYDISKTLKDDQKTYQLNLIRSDGNDEEIINSIDLPSGGGGGGSGTSTEGFYLNIERVTPSPIIVTTNDKVLITVDIQSREGEDPSSPFIDGTYTWKIGTLVLSGLTGAYSHVRNTFDLTPHLNNGTQRVSLTVQQSDSGIMQTKTWNIQVVDVRIESEFMDEYTNPANEDVAFTYIPYGAVPKIVHFRLDGTDLDDVSLTAGQTGSTQMRVIPAQPHGTHTLEVWMDATVGSSTVPSNRIYKDIIWYDENAETPIISCAQKVIRVPDDAMYDDSVTYYKKNDETGLYYVSDTDDASFDTDTILGLYYTDNKAMQYSSTTINFNVYDPQTETPTVILYEDGVEVATRTLPASIGNVWVYKTNTAGVHTLTIACGETSIDIIMNIEALENIDIQPVTANLVFDFNPEGRNNSDANRLWSYTNAGNDTYAMTVSNDFDWVNGGYQQDENGDLAFLIKAGTRAMIDCRMFGRESGKVKQVGQHFKVVFRTDNVRDAEATWLACIGQSGESEAGIKMNAHEAYLHSGNASSNSDNPTSLYSPYSEGDKIEYEYDIYPIDTTDNTATSYIMSYEDGTMFRPIVYDNNNILQQLPASVIMIGSDDCDVRIYRMKLYNASLSNKDVMDNFIADASSGEEMYARYTRNQIYTEDGYLTPEHLAEVCPDLRIISISAPHFTNKKSNTVTDTTVTCRYKGGDPVLDNWTVTGCSHSGQGTTSDNYGVSGRNIDVKFNTDTSVVTFGDGSQSAPGKVKISLTRDSIPVNYFNIKLNIASSENANNALLAKRYDRYLPYETPAHKRDSRIKTTMEFFNCVVFIQETDQTYADGKYTTHEEFNDTAWHFYGIGNIGDSKKTDKTRVYTEGDPREFVNEIQDNTKPNSRFDTGVYNLLLASLPASGDLYTDYYVSNGDGTFTQSRYLNGTWVTVKEAAKEIINGAVAMYASLPSVGISGIEYYIPNGTGYDMHIWKDNSWSTAASQTENDFADAKKRHMATAIDPRQWGPGNEKYVSLKNDGWDSSNTYEMRYEAAEKIFDDDSLIAIQHAENVSIWESMYAWMITSSDEEFVSQFEDWFIKDAALYAYLFTEQYTMMDNRAKNTFWHYAKFYVSEEEYATSDICYTKVGSSDLYNADETYYMKESGDYVVWSGEWTERPQLYVHNNCYTVSNAAAAIRDGYRFDFWDYDNDSSIGIDNTGALGLSYGKEDIDKVVDGDPTSKNVFNAADSVFFRRIRALMHNDLRSMYQRLENSGCWTASGFISEFDNWQAQWPEELWSKDMERKYVRPYFGTSYDNSTTVSADGQTVKKSSTYLEDMLNGRKKYQRRQWIRDQSIYMGTKYLASSITNNSIMLRCYEPSGAVVSPDYTLHIVPYTSMYLSVLFGSGNFPTQIRAKAGEQYEIPCPISMSGATDIPFYIYAASHIQELSDLSACYFTTNNFAGATRLKKLKVGNSTPGYSNQIQVLNLGTGRHDLLEELDVTNCDHLVGTTSGGTMNLAGCGRLKVFLAGGTAISSVIFATNGQLETAVLPDSLTGLTMIGLDKLVNFTANYDHLITLNIEGGVIDSRAIVGEAYDTLRSVRLVDIDWTGDKSLSNSDILNALSDMSRMYDSYISGRVNITSQISQRELDHYEDIWNGRLIVEYEGVIPEYLVRYLNADNTLLGYEYVIAGSYLTDPIGRTIFGPSDGNIILSTPTMEMTDQYRFVFSEWDTLEGYVNQPRIVTAVYNNITRSYTVNWYDKPNGNRLATGEYEYGSEAVYDYTPTRDITQNQNKTYYQRNMNGFAVYTGEWEERPQLFEHNPIPTDVSRESQLVFRLFTGWNRNTGYVRPDTNNLDGHVDVYAVWQECEGLPSWADLDTSTLTAAQIYGITRQTSTEIKKYFSMDGPDSVQIKLGCDPEFTNVESQTIVSEKRYFDGTSGEIVLDREGNPIRLFAEDAPSFTLAIDFEMFDSGLSGNEKTLIGCYDYVNGRLGFRLKCGYRSSDDQYRPIVEWGNQAFDVGYSYEYGENEAYYDARYRDIAVIRHIAGDPTLYVYTSNTGPYFTLSGITRYSKTRTTYVPTDAPLVLGGNYLNVISEFDMSQFATGYIYWCKIWYDDLGEYNCRRIAAWPRETLNMEYYGTQRYFLTEGGRSAASFISRKPLYGRAVYRESIYEDAVWSNSPAREFLRNRMIDALPIEWQSMLRTVYLNTTTSSGMNPDVERTEDKIYLPAYGEIFTDNTPQATQERFSQSSGESMQISWLSTYVNRAKSKIIDIRANPTVWTGTVDPNTQIGTNVRVGDIWVRSTSDAGDIYIFVDNDTISKSRLTVRNDTTPTETGGWVRNATIWGLRTPNSSQLNGDGRQYLYWAISQRGLFIAQPYTSRNGYGDGVAIDLCFSI